MSQPSTTQSGRVGLRMLEGIRRGGIYPLDDKIAELVKHMQDNDLLLRTIGTNEEELEQIRIDWYIDRARFELEVLRRGSNNYYWWHLSELWRYVRVANLSLSDIGSSEWELSRLKRKNRRSLRKQSRLLEKIS